MPFSCSSQHISWEQEVEVADTHRSFFLSIYYSISMIAPKQPEHASLKVRLFSFPVLAKDSLGVTCPVCTYYKSTTDREKVYTLRYCQVYSIHELHAHHVIFSDGQRTTENPLCNRTHCYRSPSYGLRRRGL